MKFIVALVVLFAVAAARPQSQESQATIVEQRADIAPDLSQYSNIVKTSNGIAAEESGQLKQVPNAEQPSIAARGSFTWTAPDGQQYTVTYIADENGFQPQGAHLPVAL